MTDSQKLDLLLEKATVTERNVAELKEDVSQLKEDMVEVKGDIEELKADVSQLKEDVSQLKEDMVEVKEDIEDLKTDVEELKVDAKIVKLELENEVRVNIQRVAEAHLDLSRKLEETKKPSEELEVLGIRVRNNESEIRKINSKIRKFSPA